MKTPEVTTDRADMYRTNYLAFASFSILIWDHIITFDQEVAYIWPAKKNLLMCLFMINRYVTPLGFIVNLLAYLLPVWMPETCNHLVLYEGAMTVVGINIVALMMFIRIKALYHGQRIILGFVAALGLTSFIMNAYLLTKATAVVHNPESGVHACRMVFEGDIIRFVSTSARLPLGFDIVILALTLYKTFPSLRNNSTSYIMRRLARDGFLYFSVILSLAMIWSIMIALAPLGIQNIAAAPYLLLTVAMMSRITISLKSSVDEMRNANTLRPVLPSMFTQLSRAQAAPSINVIVNQTKIVESLDFGFEMSTVDLLRRNQPDSFSTNTLGSGQDATRILRSHRSRLSPIQEHSPGSDRIGFRSIDLRRSNSGARRAGDSVGLNTIEAV